MRIRILRALRTSLVAVLVTAALSVSCGCSSIEHVFNQDQKFSMYGGTKNSWRIIQGEDPEADAWGSLFYSIDLPFTAVLDTLFLPVSAPVEMSR